MLIQVVDSQGTDVGVDVGGGLMEGKVGELPKILNKQSREVVFYNLDTHIRYHCYLAVL